jgi:hypothetical protein
MATYYVANSGNDGADGLTTSTPWQNISRVLANTYNAGDTVSFNKGDTWRAQFVVPRSGTSGSPMIFNSYGTGNKPKLYGSTKLISWNIYSGNIWVSSTTVSDPYSSGGYSAEIFFEENTGNDDITWGHAKKSSIAACVSEYDWTWSSNHIYIYSTSDPSTRYTSVEAPQLDIVFSLNNKNYITIDGLDIRYSSLALIKEVYPASTLTGLTIKNCHVAGTGTKGSNVGYGLSLWHSNALIQNNKIHDCGRRSCSYNVDNSVAINLTGVIIEGNEFYHGFHTTGPDIGHTGSSNFDNFIIRNNFIWDDPTWVMDSVEYIEDAVGIFVGNNSPSTGNFQNFYIYNNIIKNNPFKGMEFSGTTSNVNIYNNTFYGYNPSSVEFGAQIYINPTQHALTIKNNVFYNNVVHATNLYHPCIYVGSGWSGSITIDYNLYWMTDPTAPFIAWAGSRLMSDWATYKSVSGQDSHSPTPTNPSFASSSNYHLSLGSLAIHTGVYTGVYATDYDGVTWDNPPSMGAYEFVGGYINIGGISGRIHKWGIG